MLKSKSITAHVGPTLMKASYLTLCKAESTSMIGRSKVNTYFGDWTQKAPDPLYELNLSLIKRFQSTKTLTPENMLFRRVCGQAVKDCYGSKKVRQEVIDWLISDDYVTVCNMAVLPAYDLREQMYNLLDMPCNVCVKYANILAKAINGE